MIEEIKASLVELSFSPKETAVYLAMLELGPASIQDVAKKAGVNRTTTYVMIEALKRRGLISAFEKGKKMFFSVESPHKLKTIIEEEMSVVHQKHERLMASMPKLLAIYNTNDQKPRVRFFEGHEAFTQVRQEVMHSRQPLWEMFAVDEDLLKLVNIRPAERIEVSRRLPGRTLMAIKPGFMLPYFDHTGWEMRTINYEQFPFTGEIAISGPRVYMFSAKSRGIGIIIESEEIADIYRATFLAAWNGAKEWIPPKDWEKKTLEKQGTRLP